MENKARNKSVIGHEVLMVAQYCGEQARSWLLLLRERVTLLPDYTAGYPLMGLPRFLFKIHDYLIIESKQGIM